MNIQRTLTRACAFTLGVLTFASAAACTPQPQAASHADNIPVVTTDQESRIRKNILSAITDADSARDAEALKSRMTGPALAVRTSQLAIAKKNNKLDSTATIPDSLSQSVVSTSSAWPRTLLAITTVTDEQQSQRLLVLDQNSATSNYKIWGLVRLFSGVQMPKFNVATLGSEQGDAKTSGLIKTPADAFKEYANVLEDGSSSKYAKTFADDSFRQQIATLTDSVQQAIEKNEGKQSQKYTAEVKDIKVMRTADGGALAVGEIKSVWTRTAGGNRKSMPASEGEVALFGDTEATSTLEVTYVNEVALYIPPEGSQAQIRAVGAERQPVSVVAK
ncbi:hypothetical protein [Alloscardovia omnicolens]|uniref:hypothetical protein n=1 Tax=Alloscardovia omnicolens TaxID=419015 RepID=UPI003A7309D0